MPKRRRHVVTRIREALTMDEPAPARAPDPTLRDQGPARYGDGGCRWCGGPVRHPRRTFCGDACVHQYRLRSNAGYRRQALYTLKGPICAGCGVDTRDIGRALRTSPDRARKEYSLSNARVSKPRRLGGAVFDADHIQEVCQGGGGCGLENLNLLCPACHRGVTWAANLTAKKSKK